MEKGNTKLKFYYSGDGNKVELKENIFIDRDEDDELEILLDEFKRFLAAVGYHDVTISHIQNLENEEWKDVLTKYNEWDPVKEDIYQHQKKYNIGSDTP